MSMVSYAAGSRYLSLIGGVCMSFYDWYCDLPPASPQIWGEQTDVPESADWYNSSFIIAWGSNVPQTRTPDAHFFTEVRYKGCKTVAVTPDYSEVASWPTSGCTQAGHRCRAGHGDGPRGAARVLLRRRRRRCGGRSPYFDDYARRYTDLPMLVMLMSTCCPTADHPGARPLPARQRLQRQAGSGQQPGMEDPGLRPGRQRSCRRNGAIGFRWGPEGRADAGKWNLEAREARQEARRAPAPVGAGGRGPAHEVAEVAFPTSAASQTRTSPTTRRGRDPPVRACRSRACAWARPARSACAGRHRVRPAGGAVRHRPRPGPRRGQLRRQRPYTPAWQEAITGVPRAQLITVARQFAENAPTRPKAARW